MKGTNHGTCHQCKASIHYDQLEFINGHLLCAPCMKGTGQIKCYHCEKPSNIERMLPNNGHLICNQCAKALDIVVIHEPPAIQSLASRLRMDNKEMIPSKGHPSRKKKPLSDNERFVNTYVKYANPGSKPVVSPTNTESFIGKWLEDIKPHAERLTYVLKGITHLKSVKV